MAKIKLLLPLLTTALIFAFGCIKHNAMAPSQQQEFQLVYKFINEGDTNVRSFILGNVTFYPNQILSEDSSRYFGFTPITDIGANGFRAFLIKDYKAFVGCSLGCKVGVKLWNAQWSPLYAAKGRAGGNYPTGWTDYRVWQLPVTAFKTPSDSVVIFRYPSDTARCREDLFLVD